MSLQWRLSAVGAAGVLVAASLASGGSADTSTSRHRARKAELVAAASAASSTAAPAPALTPARQPAVDDRRIFPRHILVAYYGAAGTGSLGVLGEAAPKAIVPRLRKAARPYARPNRRVRIVFELISSIADASPGADGDYSHYAAESDVRRYVRAARRNHALLVLDLQPGRSEFLPQAKHFGWALRKPWVGLALDPEWRMGPHQVPAEEIGHVGAAEVNSVSRYVSRIVRKNGLRQKLFMLHQFRVDMIRHIGNVKRRPGLAMVQHVDGFGTRRQKLATYHAVAKPKRFHMGFKLFYDEDVHLLKPAQVLKIRPRIQFVSYQ
jgi:hypothetical protein